MPAKCSLALYLIAMLAPGIATAQGVLLDTSARHPFRLPRPVIHHHPPTQSYRIDVLPNR